MPRALAAAYRNPPDRATALTRPSDHGGRTVTRCPRSPSRAVTSWPTRSSTDSDSGDDSRGWNEEGKWLVWKAGASIASCRFMPKCTWLRKNDRDHWSCWSPPGVPNAR